MSEWIRARFKANFEDSRPVIFPPPAPYWETGFNEDYATVVAYFPKDEFRRLKEFWPEAKDIETTEENEIIYTSRFQKPDWWK
jgi:hypothetical protein